MVSPLDNLLSMLCLFMGLSPSMLLSITTNSFARPPGVVSFLFIMGLTPHRAPLSIFLPLICSTLLLESTLLTYILALSLSLFSALLGPSYSSPHLTNLWILLNGSIASLTFPPYFHPPQRYRSLVIHHLGLHVHQPFLNEQHFYLEWNLF
jgi:hypothetical protein